MATARLGKELWIDLHVYKALYPTGSLQVHTIENAILSVSCQLWYLTKEVVVFALWDKKSLSGLAFCREKLSFHRTRGFYLAKRVFTVFYWQKLLDRIYVYYSGGYRGLVVQCFVFLGDGIELNEIEWN